MIKLVATGMFFFVALGTGSAWTEVLSQEADNTVAGAALESIFSPRRAPAQKTMGLLQRSFLNSLSSIIIRHIFYVTQRDELLHQLLRLPVLLHGRPVIGK